MKSTPNLPKFVYFYLLIIFVSILAPAGISAEDIKLSSGQTVYVPIYSHIYSGVKGRPFDLAATLSIRNTNLLESITLVSVKYYDSDGKMVEDYFYQYKITPFSGIDKKIYNRAFYQRSKRNPFLL